MATSGEKFLNYNGLVKLIGLIKKAIGVFVKDVHVNNKSVVDENHIAKLTVDSAMSTTSENPVQNKVVDAAVKAAAKTVRQTSQSGSTALPILTAASSNHTSGNNAEAGYDADFKFTPSSNTLAIGSGTLTPTAYSGKATATETALNSTGTGKGADMVKYDSNTNYASGSVGAAITALQGAVGGGDLVKQIDRATAETQISGTINYDPNHVREGNYTKADGTGATFTYYDTTYDVATPDTGNGQAITPGKAGLMSSADKKRLDGIESGAQKNVIESIKTYDGTLVVESDKSVTIPNVVAATGSIEEGTPLTTGKYGLMSGSDKQKLDGLQVNGQTFGSTGKCNLKSGNIILTSNISVDGTSTSTVQAALAALNTLAAANKSAISTLESGGLKRQIVTELPTGDDIKENVIYMILASNDTLNGGDPSTSGSSTPYGANNNSYNEYMYINGAWERIGSTEVNLDIDAITNDEIDTAWATTVAAA